jgi:hypothetical protein
MNMTLRTLSIITLGLAAMTAARPASAGYSIQTVTATYGTPIQLQNYFNTNSTAFSLFNPNQGTLAAVFISLSSTSTVSSGVKNDSAVYTNGFTVSSTDQVTVTGLDHSTTEMAQLASNQVSGTINPSSKLTNLGPVTGTSSSVSVSQADISDYIGAGTSELSVSGSTSVFGTVTSGDANPQISFSSAALFSGTITITYEYVPAVSVPEPASIALVAIGLGGFAAATRLRRRKV